MKLVWKLDLPSLKKKLFSLKQQESNWVIKSSSQKLTEVT